MLEKLSSSSTLRLSAFDWNATEPPFPEIDGNSELSSPPTPLAPVARLTSRVVPFLRSRTKMFDIPSLSAVLRLLASELKATERPFPEIEGLAELSSPPTPLVARLTNRVVPFLRSRTKMFDTPSLSSMLRLLASDWKATKRPSAEIDGWNELSSPPTPLVARLTNRVVPFLRSRTKMFSKLSLSLSLKLFALDSKATKRPSAEIEGNSELSSPPTPLVARTH